MLWYAYRDLSLIIHLSMQQKVQRPLIKIDCMAFEVCRTAAVFAFQCAFFLLLELRICLNRLNMLYAICYLLCVYSIIILYYRVCPLDYTSEAYARYLIVLKEKFLNLVGKMVKFQPYFSLKGKIPLSGGIDIASQSGT